MGFRLAWATLTSVGALLGYSLGFTSPAFDTTGCASCPGCLNCELQLTDAEVAAFVAALSFVGIGGALGGGPFIDRVGRRAGACLVALLHLVGWSLQLGMRIVPTAARFAALMASRSCVGLAAGGSVAVLPVYLAEIAPASMRGAVVGSFQFASCAGCLSAFACGVGLAWWPLTLLAASAALLTLLGALCLPESPRWLLGRGETEGARLASLRLRPPASALRGGGGGDELLLEGCSVETEAAPAAGGSCAAAGKALCAAEARRPLLICIVLMVASQLSGIAAVTAFTGSLLARVFAGARNLAALPGAVAAVCGAAAAMHLSDRVGRRPLLLASCVGVTLSNAALASYFILAGQNDDAWRWPAFASVIALLFSFNFGLGPVTWTLQSELVPAEARGAASSLTVVVNWGLQAIVVGAMPLVGPAWTGYVFIAYASASAAAAAFTLVVVPETRNRTLEAIQEAMRGARG